MLKLLIIQKERQKLLMLNKVIFNQKLEFKRLHEDIQQVILKPDIEYLLNGDLLNALKKLHPEKIKETEEMNWVSTIPYEKAKNILFYRPGGIGDLLFIMPYLKSVKEINPEVKITFAAMNQNHAILRISKYIDYILEDPMEYSKVVGKFDKIVLFDNLIENNKEAEKVNAYDMPARFFKGLKKGLMESTIIPSKPERIDGKFHLMLSYNSSSPIRDVSPALYFEFLKSLNSDLFRVTVISNVANQKNTQELVQHVRMPNKDLEIISYADASLQNVLNFILVDDPPHLGIGPDSGLINVWGYHGFPVIGLYGPFDSHLRLKYYKHAIGIDPITDCMFKKNENGSCFLHKVGSCDLADYKDEVFSPCIHLITVNDILTAVKFMLEKVYNN